MASVAIKHLEKGRRRAGCAKLTVFEQKFVGGNSSACSAPRKRCPMPDREYRLHDRRWGEAAGCGAGEDLRVLQNGEGEGNGGNSGWQLLRRPRLALVKTVSKRRGTRRPATPGSGAGCAGYSGR